MAFHLEHGSRDEVIAELAKFQNGDGGFAPYLESDNRWHGSSPMATMIGLRMLNQVSASDGVSPNHTLTAESGWTLAESVFLMICRF